MVSVSERAQAREIRVHYTLRRVGCARVSDARLVSQVSQTSGRIGHAVVTRNLWRQYPLKSLPPA